MELVNDVLDMNKLESGQIKLEEKPFSISEILKEVETVVGMAATEHGITLTVKKERSTMKICLKLSSCPADLTKYYFKCGKIQ